MKTGACTVGLLLLIGPVDLARAQQAEAPRTPFDCPMLVVGAGDEAAKHLDPPPSVVPREPARPAPSPGQKAPESPAGTNRAGPMPTLRTRCFNPLAVKFERPEHPPITVRLPPALEFHPFSPDSGALPENVEDPDPFRLDDSMGLTPPRPK